MIKFSSLALAGVAFLGLGLHAAADSLDRTGSLLLFPLFDNARDGFVAVTVTNTNSDTSPGPVVNGNLLQAGTIDVEFVYIDEKTCLEFNRTRRLTPNDTITVITRIDNPTQNGGEGSGYLYTFAKSPITGKAIKFDWLAGDSVQVSPEVLGGVNYAPVVFKAGTGAPNQGDATDVDMDGLRDFNGAEYEQVSDELVVPRFVSDLDGVSSPELILIGLTGASFTTIVDFLVYNDNEEVFSAQFAFDCYEQLELREISGVFTDVFLDSTNDSVPEEFPAIGSMAPPVNPFVAIPQPAPRLETGWFHMDGAVAFSTAASVQDPAFLAVRVERFDLGRVAAASLPYGIGLQGNGDLVNHGPFPDSN